VDERQGNLRGAISDYRRYLALGGGQRYGDQSDVEAAIRILQQDIERQPG
jgi:hypothetical protein